MIFKKLVEYWQRENLARAKFLTDEMGFVGQSFNQLLTQENVEERFEKMDKRTLGTFTRDGRFKHSIKYNSHHYSWPDMDGDLTYVRIHEGIHALQYKNAAAANLSLFDTSFKVMLSPRDYVWRTQIIEHDAFAKAHMMIAYAAENENIPLSEENKEIARIFKETFERNAGDLKSTLIDYSNSFMNDWTADRVDNLSHTMTSVYSKEKIDLYRSNYVLHLQRQFIEADIGIMNVKIAQIDSLDMTEAEEKELQHALFKQVMAMIENHNFIYARLSQEDIAALGNSFGYNMFSEPEINPLARAPQEIPEKLNRLISEFNKLLGIQDESKLPTVTEALKYYDLSPEQYLQNIARAQHDSALCL